MAVLLVRADAGFEAVLGIALVAAGATGALGAADFPDPVGQPLVVVAGLALLALAFVLERMDERSLQALAIGNAVTALLGMTWLAAASGFSTRGAALTGAVIGVLAFLAALQTAVRAAPSATARSAARIPPSRC